MQQGGDEVPNRLLLVPLAAADRSYIRHPAQFLFAPIVVAPTPHQLLLSLPLVLTVLLPSFLPFAFYLLLLAAVLQVSA